MLGEPFRTVKRTLAETHRCREGWMQKQSETPQIPVKDVKNQ